MNTINPQNLPKIHWQNQIVITTELLAKCYGAKEKQIRQNYANNKARFVEGVHFFKLEGEQLRAFKQRSFTESCGDVDSLGDFLGQFGFQVDVVDTAQDRDVDDIDSVKIARNINSLTLWTERGAARHSKILDTDLAWDMFDRLETAYFHSARPAMAIPTETQTIIRNLQAELLKSRKRMDKVLRLQQAGFSKAESARMLAIGETTVRKEAAILKRCGFRVDAAGGQLDLFGGAL